MRLIDCDALKKDWSMADHCEDCPQKAIACQYDQVFTRMDICQMLDDAPTVGGWISVKDRLPEEHECANEDGEWLESDYVLTYVSNSLPYYPRFYIGQTVDGVWDLEGSDFLDDRDHVTHWMPLPKPPAATHDAP